jgi:site-specific recombinase XerD
MIEDMQLLGYSKWTQAGYVSAVRQLAKYYGKSPDQITEEELRNYFLYLTTEKGVAPATCASALCAFKFFYKQILGRQIDFLNLPRSRQSKKLPVVLSVEEVQQVQIVKLQQRQQQGVLIKTLMKEYDLSKSSVYR